MDIYIIMGSDEQEVSLLLTLRIKDKKIIYEVSWNI
jgi:hypothetical protein